MTFWSFFLELVEGVMVVALVGLLGLASAAFGGSMAPGAQYECLYAVAACGSEGGGGNRS